ncbi:MAG: hypothetical protein AMXMBFR57_07160 [Acidimicrobiia bacterium]
MTFREPSDALRVVTVTVNNSCNLSCPHCYLQYEQNDAFLDPEAEDALLAADCDHVAIVGKEPLRNLKTSRRSADLIEAIARSGKTVSLITNGHGLPTLSDAALKRLSWVDISLDGGPLTYRRQRVASYNQLISNVSRLSDVRALHTITGQNIQDVGDMMAISDDAEWTWILFSPLIVTGQASQAGLRPVELSQLTSTLTQNRSFMESGRARLLLDGVHLAQMGITEDQAVLILSREGLIAKTVFVPVDPILYGYLRLTYDGLILKPLDSLFTNDYRRRAVALSAHESLQQSYRLMRLSDQAA